MINDGTATFQAAELGRARFTGSVALRAPLEPQAVGWQPFGRVVVVGLQPTICMLIVTQGFVRLRLTTPCAMLWSPYRAWRAGLAMVNDKSPGGIVCVAPSGLDCVVGPLPGVTFAALISPQAILYRPFGTCGARNDK